MSRQSRGMLAVSSIPRPALPPIKDFHIDHLSYRPSSAIIKAVQEEKRDVEQFVLRLKAATPRERDKLLAGVVEVGDSARLSLSTVNASRTETDGFGRASSSSSVFSGDDDDDADFDAAPFVSIDDQGQIGIFGPSSGLHDGTSPSQNGRGKPSPKNSELIANAALQRQKEHELQDHADFDGVPAATALHLLDLHWNRQHHTFLLTYRPAFTRDLINGGPYCSTFLLNAIFACASKYSDRPSLRDDPADPRTSGECFFRRCKELLDIDRPSIPTIIGLLLLGSTFIARGEISKGWIHTGLATRMVYDLGLHLDICKQGVSLEDVEIRRRVFWGAFICDKLQSLYMGRPVAIQMRDSNVSLDLMDSIEELECWSPYMDPEMPSTPWPYRPLPIRSVSTFQHFCQLAKLMTRVLNRFYYVGAKLSHPRASLQDLNETLLSFYRDLPSHLACQPWSLDIFEAKRVVTPNVMLLHTTYHSLVVLLHRPFISDGHLRSMTQPETSWQQCSEAAFSITGIMERWKNIYTLRRAPYLLGYAAYVSCTIHVRNAALENGGQSWHMLLATLDMLEELVSAIPCIAGVAKIIRNLMRVHGVSSSPCQSLVIAQTQQYSHALSRVNEADRVQQPTKSRRRRCRPRNSYSLISKP